MNFGFLFRIVVKLFGLAGRKRPPIVDRFGPHAAPTIPDEPLVPHIEVVERIPDITPQPDPIPEPPSKPNGLRHDWRKARAAWLYPGGSEFWLASHRMMKWKPEKIQEYLQHPEVRNSTHIIVCCNTGTRKELHEKPFDGVKNPDKVRSVFRQIIENDMAPIAWCMSQEFFIQKLGRSHKKLLEYLEVTCEMISDLSHIAVPFRELGDIYDGNHMKERNQMFKAMRKGAPSLPLAEHERGLAQIPVDDFKDIDGDVISGLQTKFKTPTGGKNRPEDRVTQGGYTYDGAADFIRWNGERMSHWQRQGRMERHTNAVFEHSIPFVKVGQQWKPTRDIESAKKRGKVFLERGYCTHYKRVVDGAAFDLSAGVRTT